MEESRLPAYLPLTGAYAGVGLGEELGVQQKL